MSARTSGSAREGRAPEHASTADERVAQMATTLIAQGVDLNDEREAIRVLATMGYAHGDIIVFCDKAIAAARGRRR